MGGLTTWMPCAAGIRWDVTTGGKKEPEDATLNKYSSEAHVFFCFFFWDPGGKTTMVNKNNRKDVFFFGGGI